MHKMTNFQCLIVGIFLSNLILFTIAQEYSTVHITKATEETPVKLNCTNNGSTSYTWLYNGTEQKTDSSIFQITNSKHVGRYICISLTNITFEAYNLSAPVIGHGEQSHTVIEGAENVTLTCTSYSSPTPNFYWALYKEKKVNISGGRLANHKIKTEGFKSELTIASVDMEGRADYECLVENTAGKKNTTTLLRVRSRLAPLWPFLAIVAEVALMAIITLIFARRAKAKSKKANPAPTESVNSNNEAQGSGAQHNAKED
uniref:basigin-like isoform X1 n=1 Tax=Styela clava TaxID=7725 RepID=UPI0019398700|nr:basigin-like isoform X1 [Styela clava]